MRHILKIIKFKKYSYFGLVDIGLDCEAQHSVSMLINVVPLELSANLQSLSKYFRSS